MKQYIALDKRGSARLIKNNTSGNTDVKVKSHLNFSSNKCTNKGIIISW